MLSVCPLPLASGFSDRRLAVAVLPDGLKLKLGILRENRCRPERTYPECVSLPFNPKMV
ncbi:hypothetical protein [Almyronema epifaneia]|uniref:Uncharacterized protein n=1 Tax=Almyronema epifaneia S1 TaxID=2991925 RepID=A0ABW6IK08_9CYAN